MSTPENPDGLDPQQTPESETMRRGVAEAHANFLPFVHSIDLQGISPKMTLEQVLEKHPHVGKFINKLRSRGKAVVPVLALTGVLLYIAANKDILGGIGDSDYLAKSKERANQITKKVLDIIGKKEDSD